MVTAAKTQSKHVTSAGIDIADGRDLSLEQGIAQTRLARTRFAHNADDRFVVSELLNMLKNVFAESMGE
ncbi:hypothetical protein KPZU02_21990 [Klebsiella pneumoniae]|nr:hypothetical protein KPZU02_21990 [Klebsiella pneumoniae]